VRESSLKSTIKSGLVRNRTVSPSSVGSVENSDVRAISVIGPASLLPPQTTHSTIQSLPTLVSILRFEPQNPIPSVAFNPTPTTPGKRRDFEDDRPRGRILEVPKKEKWKRKPSAGPGLLDADLGDYSEAKRKLKKAILEHYRYVSHTPSQTLRPRHDILYRGLELLDNYRVSSRCYTCPWLQT